MGSSSGGHSSLGDNEFLETVLKYIRQIQMEDNIEDKPYMFFDPLCLQVTEKSFYDVLSQKSPPSLSQDRPLLRRRRRRRRSEGDLGRRKWRYGEKNEKIN